MNRPTGLQAFPAQLRGALALAGSILGLASFPAPAAGADGIGAALTRLDDSLPALPFTSDFEKEDGDNGPYGLTLKNTSGNAIKVNVVVLPNAGSGGNKRDIPEHLVGREESWTIYGLSTGDRVTVEAGGFAPLALTVP